MNQRFPRALALLATCLATCLTGSLVRPACADPAELLGKQPAALSAQQAFAPRLLAGADGRLQLRLQIAPGHYLYRDRLQLSDASGAPLAVPLPPGDVYDDPEFGQVAVLRGEQTIALPLPARPGAAVGLRYQGCAQGRLCYAPVSVRLQLPE